MTVFAKIVSANVIKGSAIERAPWIIWTSSICHHMCLRKEAGDLTQKRSDVEMEADWSDMVTSLRTCHLKLFRGKRKPQRECGFLTCGLRNCERIFLLLFEATKFIIYSNSLRKPMQYTLGFVYCLCLC